MARHTLYKATTDGFRMYRRLVVRWLRFVASVPHDRKLLSTLQCGGDLLTERALPGECGELVKDASRNLDSLAWL